MPVSTGDTIRPAGSTSTFITAVFCCYDRQASHQHRDQIKATMQNVLHGNQVTRLLHKGGVVQLNRKLHAEISMIKI